MKLKFLKNCKKTLAVILAVVVFVTCGVGGFFIFHQPKAKINDSTVMTQTESDKKIDKQEPHAVISPNVTMYQSGEAAEINKAITSVKSTSAGVYVDVAEGTELDTLGAGDIFFLDGSSSTPLGEPYFGKVASVKTVGGKTSLLLESPRADEVFDVLSFNTEDIFEDCETATLTALDGVTVISGGAKGTSNNTTPTATPMVNSLQTGEAQAQPMVYLNKTVDIEEEIELSIEIDIFEAYKKINSTKFKDEPNVADPSTNVYITKKGYAYHLKDCFHLKASKTVTKVSLSSAVGQEKSACKHCKPPVLDGSLLESEPELMLTGSVGLEDIKCGVNVNWDILAGKGPQDLSVNVSGDFVASAELKGGMEMELGGKSTAVEWESDILSSSLKVQGLKEKAFPIAYYSVFQQITCVPFGDRNSVRNSVEKMPISILIMVYLDLQGNLSFGVTANYEYSRHFEYEQQFFKDGQFGLNNDLKLEEPEISWGIEAGVSGAVDSHIGLSALVYVFNINFLDVGIVKVGAEAEGKLAIEVSDKTLNGSNPWADAVFYARTYVKLLDIKLLIKLDAKLFGGILGFGGGFDASWTALDFTVAEWGEKLPTWYNPHSMAYSNITASDNDAIYYKDEDGRLIMDVNDTKTVLYDKEFFVICGIDQSYIYFLKVNEDKKYSVHRVSKETQANKEIISSVTSVLHTDQENIYYVDGFNNKLIYRYNRATGETNQFASFNHKVERMVEQGGNFYVTTMKESIFFLFGTTNYYYLLNKAGQVIMDYGSDIDVANYEIQEFQNYSVARKMSQGGVLRSVAHEVRWLAKDRSQSVVAECVSGWNYFDEGVFTVHNSSQGGLPYNLVRYNATDGSLTTVTDSSSDQVIFTMGKSAAGDWYYFDEDSENLILYSMDASFANKRVIKTFPLEEIKYSLKNCGVEILDNCVYFYAITNDTNCEVIKRYDLY